MHSDDLELEPEVLIREVPRKAFVTVVTMPAATGTPEERWRSGTDGDIDLNTSADPTHEA